jgi:predicted transcriptional regulator
MYVGDRMDWYIEAQKLRCEGLSYNKIADMLNVPLKTVQSRFKRDELRGNKIEYTDKKVYGEADIDNYMQTMKAMQKAQDKLNTKQVKAHITIKDNKPIAIAQWGDWHTGGLGVDYERFERDEETIQNTDGLYWNGLGDYKDNYVSGIHIGSQYEQIIQPGMQDMAVKRIMQRNAENCIALVRGCHDDWDKKQGDKDFVETMCNVIGEERGDDGPINLWHGGDLFIQVGDIEYHFKLRHKYKFESSLNPENSMRRIMEMQGPCDVACSAHLHNPYYLERHLMGEHRIMARSGSYKIWDEFGQKIAGYKGKAGVPVIILFPDKKRMIPLYLDDAVDVLKALRS